MPFNIPQLSLVVLIGPSGSGKSTFARKHFLPTEVLSSDACRGWVSDDENDQSATNDAFDVLHYIASKRLAAGRLTVVDATNVQPEARKPLVELARRFHVLPVAILLDLPEKVCAARNADRPDRNFGNHVIRQQRSQMRRSIKRMRREGFRHVFVMESEEEIEAAKIQRVPLWNDKRDERGPFDIIGDIHGCGDELEALLQSLGYERMDVQAAPGWLPVGYRHPQGRRVVFLGDLVDRGPRAVDVLSIAKHMVESGDAFCVPGNHDAKLLRKLRGKNVRIAYGLAETLADIEAIDETVRPIFCKQLADFLDSLVSHYVFDHGQLVVAHAGLKEEFHGRGSGRVREFALYGETTGETDEFGLPVRYDWAAEYRGRAMVVYGHTPVPEPEWLNRTINIDTGCVFGGNLTALRYPEQELVSVPAQRMYADPIRPLRKAEDERSTQQIHDDLLDAQDVLGKRIISTRLRNNITIREENSVAALELMSRFAANPKWLIHLPPTMSPCETSNVEGHLEYPTEAFAYFRNNGVSQVVCEEKHMGSRAIAIVCRDEAAALERFGVEGEQGVVVTRTGRPFFQDDKLQSQFVARLATAITKAGWWDRLETNWACLDCELMPWSAKAQELLRSQYAAVGAAGRAVAPKAVEQLQQARKRLGEDEKLIEVLDRLNASGENLERFANAYQRYCWSVDDLNDYKLAPFHLLATESHVHVDKDHRWHMTTLAELCQFDDLLFATQTHYVDLEDEQACLHATQWWRELTAAGGEGMVVKSLDFITKGRKGLNQPAVKCRGREYLRIIYGPDYDAPRHLSRLRNRHLGRKQSLAIREFALGIEALERFVAREPLRRVHECVFGVLALESEPIDPRL